ncbi:MAG: PAS domain-containing protein [Magnetococcales bacterium]|nr:PAS domain-containing protein [Magnetococcales bacterium]
MAKSKKYKKQNNTGGSEMSVASAGSDNPNDTSARSSVATSQSSQLSQEIANRAPLGFPIIGLGASAGGLDAFHGFFTNLPANTGMAFILVQHMDASHQSILPTLIQNYTTMPVLQVQGSTPIEANAVYVIPPNHNLDILNGVLYLIDLSEPKARSGSIDHFFRSLAQDQYNNAACVILSGTGTDGTLGLKAIKEAGGLVVTQDPVSAKYDGMPKSAINTGMSDFILPPEQMPQALVDFFRFKFHANPRSNVPEKILKNKTEETGQSQLSNIFILLRAQIGHDFSLYKENTILRRVERRMSVHQMQKISEYVTYLGANPEEVMLLFRDFLIGVSNFFRDQDAFEKLAEKVIPKLFENRPEHKPIRIWVPGCASGEEAYSIAMLVQEEMERVGRAYPVQIFATDIDDRAIEVARSGLYPDSIAVDVSSMRLRRFFTLEGNHYRIKKTIRDMLIIAVQNVIKDPPFSNLDLISCRNLLIYMGTILQKRVHAIFHYAIAPNGFLLLGSSETTGESASVYATIDRKWKIYQHKSQTYPMVQDFVAPSIVKREKQHLEKKIPVKTAQKALGLKELTEQHLLTTRMPTCLMVNDQYEILYIHGKTGRYLEATSVDTHWNILKLAREGLTIDLASALRRVKTTQRSIHCRKLKVKTNGRFHWVDLTVEPVLSSDTMKGWSWVIFEDLGPVLHTEDKTKPATASNKICRRLADKEKELRSTKEYLQTTIEELEATNEEFKSMNEELQASNEELQSANEELETAREEAQSVNEELATINAEYEEKLITLAKTNNDMVNLMASTAIGTIFLDETLKVVRFTPSATRFVSLIPGDIGRPIQHLVSNLKGKNLSNCAEQVLDSLIPVEFETQTEDGEWLSIRVRPYRTVDNVIEGVVIAFVDISEIKNMQQSLRLSEERFKVALKSSPLGIIVSNVDEALRYTWIYNSHPKVKMTDFMGKRDDEMDDSMGTHQLLALKRKVLESGTGAQEVIVLPTSEGLMTCKVSAEPLLDYSGKIVGVTTAAIDITEMLENKRQ